ncbi:MAG: hypothetical protein MI741_09365 [Rhodospirillales bacterium]|nr:hypothetical protein [Rhodospirillales bacterium]
MQRSVAFSCVLHAAVFAVAYHGLPELRREVVPMGDPIVVEIVNEEEPEPIPAPPEPEPEPEPAPPPPEPEPAPPPPEPEPAPPPPEPEPEVAAVPQPPKPEPKPEPKPKPEAKPKPKAPESLAKAKPRRKPKPPDPFASVLKTVEELKKTPRPPIVKKDEKPEKKKESFDDLMARAIPTKPQQQRSPMSNFMAQRRAHELARKVVEQVSPCWSFPAGAKEAQTLSVELSVAMGPDGRVQSVKVTDASRMNSDPPFRTAAEAAIRAITRCSPLRLPVKDYQDWKNMTVNFDPKVMLGFRNRG